MTRGFTHIHRLGHAAAGFRSSKHSKTANLKREPSSDCSTGGFYKTPAANEVLNSNYPVNITWDTSCLDTSKADLYLLAPTSTVPRIHLWQNLDFTTGSFSDVLKPKWWNDTESQPLQFLLLPAGSQPYTNTLPPGPLFNMTYTADDTNAANADTSTMDSTVEDVSRNPAEEKKAYSGKVAAGVLVPILIIALLGIAYYVKMRRAKTADKTKRFSEMVDKRMSTISTDWKSLSAAGASAAIRSSIAISSEDGAGGRASLFGSPRPSSSYPADGGQAGIGASHLRPGLRTAQLAERVSRVSFAEGTRPSGEYRRNATSRAFHNGFVPPVPALEESDIDVMSPTQSQGAIPLSNEEISHRASEAEDVMPALSMMRTGGNNTMTDNEYILPASPPPSAPAPFSPTQSKSNQSPVGTMPMPNMSAGFSTPDDMLRAYAERRAGTPSNSTFGGQAISYPLPAASVNSNGMRVLYSPTTPNSAAPMMSHDDAYSYNP
jgi:hypothetical protein